MSWTSTQSAEPDRKVYGVTELTRRIKAALEERIGAVWVEGELSNVRQPASGHYYFTVRDENAQLAAVLFRGHQRQLGFKPADGLLVRAFGDLTVYERGGNYQLVVRCLEEAGKGLLQARFEALKAKLLQEGLFDPSRKRPIPMLPRHLGVVTSPTGAAIRDILNVVTRRFPNLHLVVVPVKVQGEGAAREIADGIDLLNARGGMDAMIVGRGGGSMEDLWCFNDEIVARAIARSRIPVISAVGHEIDFTISDFVADLRAPTPSAAAELVVARKNAFEDALSALDGRLVRRLRQVVERAGARLRAAAGCYVFREPGNLARQYRQRLENIGIRMRHRAVDRIREGHQRMDAARMRLERDIHGAARDGLRRIENAGVTLHHAMTLACRNARQELEGIEGRLQALNPLAVLKRGYSVTSDEDGRIVRSAGMVRQGQRILTRVHEGRIESEVTGTGSKGGV